MEQRSWCLKTPQSGGSKQSCTNSQDNIRQVLKVLDMVRCVCPPGSTSDMLVEFLAAFLEITMVKIPCKDVNSLRIRTLLATNDVMQMSQG